MMMTRMMRRMVKNALRKSKNESCRWTNTHKGEGDDRIDIGRGESSRMIFAFFHFL